MDEEIISSIKTIFTMLGVILAPVGGFILYLYRDKMYKYWNKLDKIYKKLRRKFHV